ncbi:hypothetical protein [Nocardiopsis sp. MG754419]|uniref:hypothetical protein n=1 Tax=Nocardiopsis sp. MG754419 TaxID=2259865 RepID=UPI001BA7F5F4|nr:hypothetical protein [Nocardiopsis sp. MG754419]MBR8745219.1 hypothetical protein [Nocardiopsis sp. MG754419]
MEIDWPRTLAVGGLTAAVMLAIYAADTYQAYRSGEISAGLLVPLFGMAGGLAVGLLVANLVFA